MTQDKIQTRATPRKPRIMHTVSSWSAFAAPFLIALLASYAMMHRVVSCLRTQGTLSTHISVVCSFRATVGVALIVGALIFFLAFIFLAEHDPKRTIENLTGKTLLTRPRHVAGASWRALRDRSTPHRKKTIGSGVGMLIAIVLFFSLRFAAEIAFEGLKP